MVSPVPPPAEPPDPRTDVRRVRAKRARVCLPTALPLAIPRSERAIAKPDGGGQILQVHATAATRTEKLKTKVFSGLCRIPKRSESERPRLHWSQIAQADGLLYKEVRVRIERDVMAPSMVAAASKCWGPPPAGVPLGAVEGLYWAPRQDMPAVVAAVASQHGRGLFVVTPPSECEDQSVIGNIFDSDTPGGKARHEGWYDFLRAHKVMTFDFEGSGGLVGVYASFFHCQKLRAPKRGVAHFDIKSVPQMGFAGKLGPVADVLARATTPLPDTRSPVKDDRVREPDFVLSEHPVERKKAVTTWNVEVFTRWARTLPDETIRQLAVDTVMQVLDPRFKGDKERAVSNLNSKNIVGREKEIEAHLQKEADLGRVWGPMDFSPFVHGILCKLNVVPKDKWNALDPRFRLVSDYSKGGDKSVNEQCYTPRLIAMYARGCHIRDLLAHWGREAYCRAYDVPACYRNQAWAKKHWPLFMYRLLGKFWVDMHHGFGSTASEWSWQCVLAVLMWRARCTQGWAPICIVDNIFCIGPKARVVKMADAFVADCEEVGLPLHEPQEGKQFNAVGWDWDVAGEVHFMSCPVAKYMTYARLASEWAGETAFSVKTLERILGLMVFLSAGFRVAEMDITFMYSRLTEAKSIAAKDGHGEDHQWYHPSERMKFILTFWDRTLTAWDRRCVIVGAFSPVSQHSVLGHLDAATRVGHGWGAVYVTEDVLQGTYGAWSDAARTAAVRRERESTGQLEMDALVKWLQEYGPLCEFKRVLLLCDNMAACQCMSKGFSDQGPMEDAVRAARVVVCTYGITLRVMFIPTQLNVVADSLSHMMFTQAKLSAWELFGRRLRLRKCQPNGSQLPRC